MSTDLVSLVPPGLEPAFEGPMVGGLDDDAEPPPLPLPLPPSATAASSSLTSPRRISGALHPTEPPITVVGKKLVWSSSSFLHNPKSLIIIRCPPFLCTLLTRMFCGLISRWTIFNECRCFKPDVIWCSARLGSNAAWISLNASGRSMMSASEAGQSSSAM